MKINGKTISALVLLLALSAVSVMALEGMVIRIEQDSIVINRGITHQLQPQSDFYVSRLGAPVAVITVVQVDEYSSICKLKEAVPGGRVSVGDTISTTPFAVPAEKTGPSNQSGTKTPEEIEREKQKARLEYEKNIEENYKKVVEKKTQIVRFKKGAGGSVKVETFDIFNLLSTTISGPYASINAWYAAGTAYGTYAKYKASQDPSRIRNLQVEITLWDTEYLDAFATYSSKQNQNGDSSQLRENIFRQKGLDKFYVFQVKIINPGPGPVQMAPFPWHCYLKGPEGKRIKADNYDEILDKALDPNQVVNGYVYFSRFDEQNRPVLSSETITLELVDVLGNNKDVNFK